MEIFYSGILQEYARLQLGYDILKEVSRLAEDIDEPACFALLKTALESLHDTTIPLTLIRLWFALQLFELQGQGMNLQTDIHGQPLEATKRYHYAAQEKAFSEAPQGHYDGDAIKFLRLAQEYPPAVLKRVAIAPALLEQLNDIVR